MPAVFSRIAIPLMAAILAFAEEPIVFRSDVALARVDAQVVDRNNRAITGLQIEDFVLFVDGQKREIRNFEAEDMPMDVLLLLDVSGSMESHIQRLASASEQALRVLGPDDRVAIMVFDRSTRVRLPLKNNRDAVVSALENVLNQESFDGGTDITRALHDAASYMEREGRRNARRAIVILTDDQTERGSDVNGVLRSLARADTVLSAMITPDAMGGRYGTSGGGYPRGGGGGGWPSGGGGMGGPMGGIIFGRRGPYGYPGGGGGYPGGGRYPGGGYPGGGGYPSGGGRPPVVIGGHTSSAGTEQIAKTSGGDSMRVENAAALEETLTRIRQRYALHYNVADAAEQGRGDINLQLSDAARRRYPGSEVRYRKSHAGSDDAGAPDPVSVSRTPSSSRRPDVASTTPSDDPSPRLRRRRAPVNEDGTRIDGPQTGAPDPAPADGVAAKPQPSAESQSGGWRRVEQNTGDAPAAGSTPAAAPETEPAAPVKAAPAPDTSSPNSGGGWRRVKPGEQP